MRRRRRWGKVLFVIVRGLFAIGMLAVLNSAAAAQFLEESKSIKFGTGCRERVTAMEARLGVCMISPTRARIWCPNGKVFERDGALPTVSLIRSACSLSQVL